MSPNVEIIGNIIKISDCGNTSVNLPAYLFQSDKNIPVSLILTNNGFFTINVLLYDKKDHPIIWDSVTEGATKSIVCSSCSLIKLVNADNNANSYEYTLIYQVSNKSNN